MTAGGVVSLKFVKNLCRSIQQFFQIFRMDQGGGAVHFVKMPDIFRNGDQAVLFIHFLCGSFSAKHFLQCFSCYGFHGFRVQQRRDFPRHVRPHVVPVFREFLFFENDFVREFPDCFSVHFSSPFVKKTNPVRNFRTGSIKKADQTVFVRSAVINKYANSPAPAELPPAPPTKRQCVVKIVSHSAFTITPEFRLVKPDGIFFRKIFVPAGFSG